MEAINPEVAKFVLGLKHNPKTDLAKGQINNQDFIILMLASFGPFGLKELRELSMTWRGGWTLETYFGPHNGYTGKYFDSHVVHHEGWCLAGGAPKHHPYWYRARASVHGKHRYANALSLHGMQRLSELMMQIPV